MRTDHNYDPFDGDVVILSSSPPPFTPRSPRKRPRKPSVELATVPSGSSVTSAKKSRDVIVLTDSDEAVEPTRKWKGKGKAKEVEEEIFAPNLSQRPKESTRRTSMGPTPLLFASRGYDLDGQVDELDDDVERQVENDPSPEALLSPAPNQVGPSLAHMRAASEEDMDDDMRMAIELSWEEGLAKLKGKARAMPFETGRDDGWGAKRKGKQRVRTPLDDESVFEFLERRGSGTVDVPNAIRPANPVHGHIPATGTPRSRPVVDLTLDHPSSPIPTPDANFVLEGQSLDTAPPGSPRTTALIHILEIIPNIQPEYVQGLIDTEIARQVGIIAEAESQERAEAEVNVDEIPAQPLDGIRIAERLVGELLEETGWPKVERKGKAKRKSDAAGLGTQAGGSKKPRVDWKSRDRVWEGGLNYVELALIHLQTSFPLIPKAYLRRQLQAHNSHYAPTHITLTMDEEDVVKRKYYTRKTTGYRPGRDVAKATRQRWKDEILEEERKWIEEWESERDGGTTGKIFGEENKEEVVDEDVGEHPQENEDEALADGEGIECQCCFTEYSFSKMVQCPEAHLFCSDCVSQYASSQLGSHNPSILCMHSSGCAQPFPVSELHRILPVKIMELYDRVKQQKEIEEAELDDLEECPFCEYKCVIDRTFEEEKLFRCGNEDGGCGVVSCRQCKKEDHLPKSCSEVEEDKHLDGQHAVEEAMTRALMRNCPKCKKPFIKEYGCNKMTCPNCHTSSCYVCRQIITGYDHFNQGAPNQAGSSRGGKCLLSDSVEQRHAEDVKAAAEKAMAQLKESHPDADADKIKIDIPGVKPQGLLAIGGEHIQQMWAGAFGAVGNLAPAVGFGGDLFGAPRPAPAVRLPPLALAPPPGRRGRRAAQPRRGRAAVPVPLPQPPPMVAEEPQRPRRQKRGRA